MISKKTVSIEGMSCGHCVKAVEKALSALEGVSGVKVDLEAKKAEVELSQPVEDSVLKKAIEDEDFRVISIA